MEKLPEIAEVFANHGHLAGLTLFVLMVVFCAVIRRLRLTKQKDVFKIIVMILVIVTGIFGTVAFKEYEKEPSNAIEVDSNGDPYAFTTNQLIESFIAQRLIAFELYSDHQLLEKDLDVSLKNKVFNQKLIQQYLHVSSLGRNEIERVNNLANNKALTPLIFLNGTIVGGSNLFMSTMYENAGRNEECVKYAKIAEAASKEALDLIANSDIYLSPASKQFYGKWLSTENHLDRYRTYNFLAKALLYKHDRKSNISRKDLADLYNSINVAFMDADDYNNPAYFPIVGWLQEQGIIATPGK